MPHFTIEYSASLDDRIDMRTVVELVRREAVATGIFPLGGIRVRAIPCPYVAIADGTAGLNFLAMLLRLGEGRDLAARQQAGAQIFDALSRHLDSLFVESGFALSFDIQINDPAMSWKRNSIHERVGSTPRAVGQVRT